MTTSREEVLAKRLDEMLLAFTFLTLLPVRPRREASFAASRTWFPLVGLALGGALAGLDTAMRHAFPLQLMAAVDVALLLIATRAMHAEGFVDCCDALPGGYSRERRLEIMRDPHIGAFGALGGAALLLVSWAALASVPVAWRVETLVLFPCLSRLAMLVAMEAFPYAREQGMGTAFQQGREAWQLAVGTAIAGAASVAIGNVAGISMLALAVATPLAFGRWMSALLGGLTGDAYGAINEVTSVLLLLLAAGLSRQAVSTFGW